MNKTILLFSLFCTLFFSCVGLDTASSGLDENDTFVVGQIFMEFKNEAFIPSLNAKKVIPILITIESLDTGRVYKVNSNSKAFFYLFNVPEGRYKISELYLYYEEDGHFFKFPRPVNWYFDVESGKVNNLGRINWYIETIIINADEIVRLTKNYGYNELRQDFTRYFPDSGWNEKEWVESGYNSSQKNLRKRFDNIGPE